MNGRKDLANIAEARPGTFRSGRAASVLAALVGFLTFVSCANPSAAAGGWSGVAHAGDVVYVGSMQGQVVALDAETGTFQANFPKDNDRDVFGALYGTPTLEEGAVFIGGFNGKVYRLSQNDLQPEAAPFEVLGDAISKGVTGSVAAANGRIVLGATETSETGRLHVLNATDMSETCRYPSDPSHSVGRVWSTPLVSDSVAYFGDLSHRLYGVSISDCSELWAIELGGAIASTPLIVDDILYIGTFDRIFYAVHVGTGEATQLFTAGSWFWSGIATDGTLLYIPNLDGTLYAYDLANGSMAWEYDTNGPILAAPVVIDDRVVVASDSGIVSVLSSSGSLEWEYQVNAEVRAPLAARGSVVYLAALDQTVHAIDVQARRVFWREPASTKR